MPLSKMIEYQTRATFIPNHHSILPKRSKSSDPLSNTLKPFQLRRNSVFTERASVEVIIPNIQSSHMLVFPFFSV
jgi:hypothetical protein